SRRVPIWCLSMLGLKNEAANENACRNTRLSAFPRRVLAVKRTVGKSHSARRPELGFIRRSFGHLADADATSSLIDSTMLALEAFHSCQRRGPRAESTEIRTKPPPNPMLIMNPFRGGPHAAPSNITPVSHCPVDSGRAATTAACKRAES